MNINSKDALAGTIFCGFGLFFAGQALMSYDLGTSFQMGPGYTPLAIGSALFCIGAVLAIRSLAGGRVELGAIPWRGLILITGATIFFGATVEGLGLAPSLFVTTLAAGLASSRLRPHLAVLCALLLSVFCIAVFSYGLGAPMRLFGPWLGG